MRKQRDGSFTAKAKYRVTHRDTIPQLLRNRAQERPDQRTVELRTEVGSTRVLTASEVQGMVDDAARGLVAKGVQPGEHVAILSSTSFEWAILDLAVLTIGAVTVPIYESDSAAQIHHILTDADIVHAFTATTQQAELIKSVRTPALRHVESLDRGAMRALNAAGRAVPLAEVDRRHATIDTDDVATIIYTSGTTGVPKGVVLTHRNFVGTAHAIRQIIPHIIDSPDTRLLLFLPLAHVMARIILHLVLSGQGTLGFSPDVKRLLPDLEAFRPTVLLAVPRVLEKVYNAAATKAGSGLKRTIFAWSAKQARDWSQARSTLLGPSPLLRLRHRIADSLVLSKVRAVLGPDLTHIFAGGAPLAADLGHFFEGAGITLVQGYGLTETTGPISAALPGESAIGTVGRVLPGNSIRLSPEGEVQVKGVSVMSGYHGLPEETAKVLHDGWFSTGDLGSIDRRGTLRITGRKKELIVTAGGKNVSPEILEDALQTHPLIGHIVAVGEARPYIGALITLDPEMLPAWLRSHGLEVVDATRAAHLPEVHESLDQAIQRANKQVSRAESIRRFRIVDTVFTVENGYLTPSMKLRRSKVLRDFAHEIDALYAEGEQESHTRGA